MELRGDAGQAGAGFGPLQADDPVEVAGYRVAARIGAGGMGRVYLSHTQGGRPVALKVVRSELADDPSFRRRFRREMEAARRVRGAYTAELIDGDADADPPWLATLYVPGPSLSEAVARRGPLPVPAVLWLMAGVAEALQAIHAAGVVHRDLKPSNVLLAGDGPRVIDFGISLASGLSSYTATSGGLAIGTPQYMAPEQASGTEVTEATDVFALGQTAAFAALGAPLYGDGPGVTVLYRIVHERPDLSPLPEELRPLMARCLAADPADRATPAEIVEWCRERLGGAAGAGGASAVWREVVGTEVPVPGPVPGSASASASASADTARFTVASPQAPLNPWAPPTEPSGLPVRRRGVRLAVGAAVTASVLVLSVLAWTVGDAGGLFGRDKGNGSGVSAGASAGASPSVSASASGVQADAADDSSGADPGAATSPAAEPTVHGESQMWLDAKNSLSFDAPYQRKDRKGEIRFSCRQAGCELTSDTAVFMQIFGTPDADRDMCDLMTKTKTGKKSHTWPLAASAAGTQFCVRSGDGRLASMVIDVKSTAMPDIAFLSVDMAYWSKV
ncbi:MULTISPECIES: serine/threonine-protein kinase [unclassified Streptomyces]|uniref:serine/threonine-protein kinase n=1 Tax=unclassified Streptomyces TaxID=2593676 RepID=UPI000DB9669C|nr:MULTISPECIES: serine/threonine-protein kinase [unclassified Streptomyces]MYT68821.1 protein kinase [Streptomyces sp. SID8367]RAJ86496.1 serine/threonine protein kinase [Streptomyces sp. PsTaAH-137]